MRFPSMKRDQLVADIRAEWREGAALVSPPAVAAAVETAVRGLETLRKYTSLDPRANEWEVTLEQNPLNEPVRESGVEPVGTAGAPRRL